MDNRMKAKSAPFPSGIVVADIIAVTYSDKTCAGYTRVITRFGRLHWPLCEFKETMEEARVKSERDKSGNRLAR